MSKKRVPNSRNYEIWNSTGISLFNRIEFYSNKTAYKKELNDLKNEYGKNVNKIIWKKNNAMGKNLWVLINIRYLRDVNENIHHFDVAFYRMTFQFLLIAGMTNKQMKKNKKKRHAQKQKLATKWKVEKIRRKKNILKTQIKTLRQWKDHKNDFKTIFCSKIKKC